MTILAPVWVSPGDIFAFQATDEFNQPSGCCSAVVIGVVLAVGIAIGVLAGLKAWERSRGRGRQIRASAQEKGFDFVERGHQSLERLRFDVFMEATGFQAASVVSKKGPDGRRVFAFDYQLINEFELYKAPDGSTHRRRKGDPNTIGGAAVGQEIDELDVFGAGATVALGSFLRNVVIQPFDWHVSPASRLPSESIPLDLDPDFGAIYRVRADDADFARQLVSPKLAKILVRTGGQFGVEVRGNQLLLFANEIKAGDMCDMALLAGVCADMLDPELLEAYPEVVGVESDGSPRLAVRDSSFNAPLFPEVDAPQAATGPVLPDTLSGRTVPILSSEPRLPIEEATFPEPPPPATAQPTDLGSLPTESAESAKPAPAPKPEAPPKPAPESVDWSL